MIKLPETFNRLFFTSQLVTLVLTTFTGGVTVILAWLTALLVLNIVVWILWKNSKCLRGVGYWALSLSPYPVLILLVVVWKRLLWKLE